MKKFYLKIFIIISILMVLILDPIQRTSKYYAQKNDNAKNFQTSKKTIINVPIDSRPVSRINFGDLVGATEYEYIEISDGLDNMGKNTDVEGKYAHGDHNKVWQELRKAIFSRDDENSDTIVLLNLSSYFFDGLIETRNWSAYDDMEGKISELETILSQYPNPKYYVIMPIPRIRPDFRTIEYPDGTNQNTKIATPVGFEDTQNIIDTSENSNSISFEEAVMIWQYTRGLQNCTDIEYSKMPKDLQTWCNTLYTEYGEFLENYWSIFTKTYEYIQKINELQLQPNINFEYIICCDDYENPRKKNNIPTNEYMEKYLYDDQNKFIRYSGAEQILREIEKKNSDTDKQNDINAVLWSGLDEIDHVILARELIKNNNTKMEIEFLDPVTKKELKDISEIWGYRGGYERENIGDSLTNRYNYINELCAGNNQEKIKLYIAIESANPMSEEEAKKAKQNVYDALKESKGQFTVGIVSNEMNKNYFNELCLGKEENGIFSFPSFTSWGTHDNSYGIAIANTTVHALLQKQIREEGMTKTLRERLKYYNKVKLRNILEDAVYNNIIKPQVDYNEQAIKDLLSSGLYKGYSLSKAIVYSNADPASGINLLKEYENNNMQIGNVQYVLEKPTINATNPWYRQYEVRVEIESISVKTKCEAKGHTEVIDKAEEATCTKTGLTEGKHCSVCNEVLLAQKETPALGHSWKEATCETPKTCERCGKTEGEALGHDWEKKWILGKFTSTGICTRCGEECKHEVWEKVTLDGHACKECDKYETHTWDSATGKCTKCQAQCTHTNWKAATCEEPKTCTTCGKTEGQSLGGHKWNATTGTCEVCKQKCTHNWEENGTECSICHMQCEHNIEKWLDNPDGDCHVGTCTICGSIFVENHTFGDVESATCEEDMKCTKCEYIEEKALGHDWDAETGKCKRCKKECTHEWNKETGICKICNMKCTHNWKEATCETAKTCERCGKTEGEALGHSWKEATCETAKTCKRCGKVEGKAKGHTEVIDKKVEPTCTQSGLTEGKHCSVCNKVLQAQTKISALGHDYKSVVTKPTTTKQGYTTHTCTRCGDSYKDSYTAPIEEPESLYIASSIYNVGDKYISKIKAKTTVKTLKEKLSTNATNVTISNKGTTLKETDYIGTGMKITFKLGEETKEYTLVVTGDITGDGKLQNGDLIKLVRYRVELITLEEPYKLAADVNGDGKVADSDIIKLARILVGIK